MPVLAARWCGARRAAHVPLDGSLRDPDAKLEELAPDAFRSPESVLSSDAADELDRISVDSRFTELGGLGTAFPEKPEALSMPAQNGLGLH